MTIYNNKAMRLSKARSDQAVRDDASQSVGGIKMICKNSFLQTKIEMADYPN